MYGVLMTQDQAERPPLPTSNEEPPENSMAPPPPGEFTSREDLLEFQKGWAERQGFAVVIGRSRPNRLWIKCDRGGEYSDKHLHDPENRKRKRKATRLTGCPFNVKATMKKDKIWRCHTENGTHNHPPSEDLSIHPSLRRMTDEQLHKVNEMTEAGNTPVETLDELQRLWPGIKVLRRDIYNARKKYKTEKELADFAKVSQSTPSNVNVPQPPFEDPNGKIPGPTPNGRWAWLEDGDEIKRKKRKKSSTSGTPTQPPQALSSGPMAQANLAPELREQPQVTQQQQPQQSQQPQQPQQPLQQPLQQPQQQAPPPPQQPTARRQRPAASNPARPSFQQAQPSTVQQQQQQQQQQIPPGMRPPEQDFPGNMNPSTRSPDQFRHYTHTGAPSHSRQPFRTPSQSSGSESMPQQPLQGPPRGPPQNTQQGQSHRTRGGQDTMAIGPMVSVTNANGSVNQQQHQQAAPTPAPAPASQATGGSTKHQSGQMLMSRIERMEKEQRDQKQLLSQILGAVQGIGMNGMRRQ